MKQETRQQIEGLGVRIGRRVAGWERQPVTASVAAGVIKTWVAQMDALIAGQGGEPRGWFGAVKAVKTLDFEALIAATNRQESRIRNQGHISWPEAQYLFNQLKIVTTRELSPEGRAALSHAVESALALYTLAYYSKGQDLRDVDAEDKSDALYLCMKLERNLQRLQRAMNTTKSADLDALKSARQLLLDASAAVKATKLDSFTVVQNMVKRQLERIKGQGYASISEAQQIVRLMRDLSGQHQELKTPLSSLIRVAQEAGRLIVAAPGEDFRDIEGAVAMQVVAKYQTIDHTLEAIETGYRGLAGKSADLDALERARQLLLDASAQVTGEVGSRIGFGAVKAQEATQSYRALLTDAVTLLNEAAQPATSESLSRQGSRERVKAHFGDVKAKD